MSVDLSIFTKSFLSEVGEFDASVVKKSPMFPFFRDRARRLNPFALLGEKETYMDMPNGCTVYLTLDDELFLEKLKVTDTETEEILIDWDFSVDKGNDLL